MRETKLHSLHVCRSPSACSASSSLGNASSPATSRLASCTVATDEQLDTSREMASGSCAWSSAAARPRSAEIAGSAAPAPARFRPDLVRTGTSVSGTAVGGQCSVGGSTYGTAARPATAAEGSSMKAGAPPSVARSSGELVGRGEAVGSGEAVTESQPSTPRLRLPPAPRVPIVCVAPGTGAPKSAFRRQHSAFWHVACRPSLMRPQLLAVHSHASSASFPGASAPSAASSGGLRPLPPPVDGWRDAAAAEPTEAVAVVFSSSAARSRAISASSDGSGAGAAAGSPPPASLAVAVAPLPASPSTAGSAASSGSGSRHTPVWEHQTLERPSAAFGGRPGGRLYTWAAAPQKPRGLA